MKAAGNLIGGTFMKKITLKRQAVYRRAPEQPVARPDLVQRLDDLIHRPPSAGPSAKPPHEFAVELHRCLQSKQWKAQTLSIKRIGTSPPPCSKFSKFSLNPAPARFYFILFFKSF
jgi:hypothetical protein